MSLGVQKLTRLQRQRENASGGIYITNLARAIATGNDATSRGVDVERLRLQLLGIAGLVKQLEGRVITTESALPTV